MVTVNLLPKKQCIKCKKLKPLSYFNKYENESFRNLCKRCQRAKTVEWEESNKQTYVPAVPSAPKKCSKCLADKTSNDFHCDKSRKDGLTSRCKLCANKHVSQFYKNNKESENHRAYKLRLKRDFGITLEQKEKMFAEQGSRCAACRSKDPNSKYKTWHVDHDHKTEKIRGILCHPCNVALGCVEDSVSNLVSLIEYLNRTTTTP